MDDHAFVNTSVKDSYNSVANKGFGGRLDYLRWLWQTATQQFGSNREFAEFTGVNYDLFMKWHDSAESPPVRATAKAFVSGGLAKLGATEDWLIDGKGEPPQPELWELWSRTGRLLGAKPPGDGGRRRKEG